MNHLEEPNRRRGIDIPPPWENLLRAIAEQGSLCLVIGPTDAGKSTFCLLAADYGLRAGRRPALLDTDPGQSDLGPPAALGLALVEKPLGRLEEAAPTGLHFVGATSPVGHLLEVTTGAARLAQRARRRGADLIIVNTSGLVRGGIARALKMAKIALLSPSHVVSISAAGETEAILAGLRGRSTPAVHRLAPSRQAVSRSPEERRKRRESKFAAYFRGANEMQLDLRGLSVPGGLWLSGKPLEGVSLSYAEERLEAKVLWGERTAEGAFFIVEGRPNRGGEEALAESFGGEARTIEKRALEKLLIGLVDDAGEDIALGIIEAVDFKQRRMTLLAPLSGPERVRGVRLGSLRVSAEGVELESLPPSIWR